MVMYLKCGHRIGDISETVNDWCPDCKIHLMRTKEEEETEVLEDSEEVF